MTEPALRPPVRRPRRRSPLESPWLAAGLVVVAIALFGAVLVVPGLLASKPGSSATPAEPSGAPSASPSPAAPTFIRPTPSPQPSFAAYTVRPGDTLSSIAREFRTTARSIAWWNRGAYPSLDPESEAYDPNHLEIGWVLAILPDTVVDENNPPTPSPGPPTPSPGPATAAPLPSPTA